TSELNLTAGEILTVLQDNVEGGWVEGKNARGKIGLFPATYVIPYSGPPAVAPPAPPPVTGYPLPSLPSLPTKPPAPSFDDWGSSTFGVPAAPAAAAPSYGAQSSGGSGGLANLINRPPSRGGAGGDDFDDEWSDEEEEEEHVPSRSASQPAHHGGIVPRSQSAGEGRTVSTVSSSNAANSAATAGKLKGNMNIFSNFVKSGMEAYVLSADGMKGQPGERHDIVISDGLIRWRGDSKNYVCTVDKPKKETKMKGLKSFIAYSITSSLSGIQVSRRYKHFDWLHEILTAKYITIALPPLPEKQVSGRYEDDLIDHRMHILQLWVEKICRHPVLSKSDVWLHFLTCTDEKQWKIGKRKAEKDEFIGGSFLNCVHSPDAPLNPNDVERQVEMFNRSIRQMEEGSRVLTERMNTYQRLLGGPVKQNWQKLAAAFSALGHSFKDDGAGPASMRMADALQTTAHHYHVIGDDFENHAKNDVERVLERVYSYRGTISRAPDICNIHKQAITKWRNTENAVVEGKIGEAQAVKVKQRVDNTSYVILAEVNHLNSEKTEDFKQFIGAYLRQQQKFYQQMANTMGDLAKQFE
ncbi:lst-4, partial [Pristionchus pacificus]